MRLLSLLLLLPLFSEAQYFNNSNNELSYELYRKTDLVGEFRIFVVVDEIFTEKDLKMLENWKSYGQATRTLVAQRWGIEGKRVEAERYPYISKPPVFPKDLKPVELLPVKSAKPIDWSGWEGSREHWLYEDRPF